MMRQRIGSGILVFSIVMTVLVVAIADVFNRTHLFNPDWPPHARFHIGMQFAALLLVSLFSLHAWKEKKWKYAALSPLTFWPGLFIAWMIPGTSPYATPQLEELGFAINLWLAGIFIVLTGLGWIMTSRKAV